MNIDEIKQEITMRTGVPESLLTGETVEENIAQAKAFLAYKKEYQANQQKTNAKKFEEWTRAQLGVSDPQDTTGEALAEIEAAARAEAGGYGLINDNGEALNMPDMRPTREKFAEWTGVRMAFDPFKGGDGWRRF